MKKEFRAVVLVVLVGVVFGLTGCESEQKSSGKVEKVQPKAAIKASKPTAAAKPEVAVEASKPTAEVQPVKEMEAAAKDIAVMAEMIVDEVTIGDANSEKAHNLQGNEMYNGVHLEKNWRDARDGGWFSYDMKVVGDKPMVLECTWWGGDAGREFKIFVDDKEVAAVTFDESHGEKFYEAKYAVPEELTKGKDKITVKFQAPEEGFAGGIFGFKTIK